MLLGAVCLVGALFAADWWTKQGKPPPTNLRCANCPKLTIQVRRFQLLSALLGVGLVVVLSWGLTKH